MATNSDLALAGERKIALEWMVVCLVAAFQTHVKVI